MTTWISLLEWVSAWGRRPTHRSEPSRPIFAIDRSAPAVPAEYRSLYIYLERRYASVVVLTFEQMEALLGFALPTSACTESDWWTMAAVSVPRYSAAWTEAGRTATPNIPAKIVTFERR